jgi:hypothetical protein
MTEGNSHFKELGIVWFPSPRFANNLIVSWCIAGLPQKNLIISCKPYGQICFPTLATETIFAVGDKIHI